MVDRKVPYSRPNTQLSIGNERVTGLLMLVKRMNQEQPSLPLIILENYDDFRRFAVEAALVTYKPEYFHSPFLDDEKRLRRVTLHAIGVKHQGVVLTFKYTFDFDSIYDPSKSWDDQVRETNQFLSEIIAGLEEKGNLVHGSIKTERGIGESLALI